MRAAIYVRVSTEDQAQHGYSLPEQREACARKARAAGATGIVIYADEGISGEVLDRPGLTALREAVQNGRVDAIFVRDADRLSRDMVHQHLLVREFDRAGVKVTFLDANYDSSPEGRLAFAVLAAVAEFEKHKIRQRTMRGKRQKARQGRIPDVFNCYGYRLNPGTGEVELDEAEASIVREIFQLFITGDSGMNGIARVLNERGVPTKSRRAVWSKSTIRQMLTQHAYTGTWFYGKRDCRGLRVAMQQGGKWRPKEREREEWIPVPVPAIIDRVTWERAKERLAGARRLWAGQNRAQNLVSGIICCGDCGVPMNGRKQKLFGRHVRGYTCCRTQQGAKRRGCRPWKFVHAERLEAAVWNIVRARVADPGALARAAIAAMRETPGGRALRAELAQIEEGLAQVERGRENILAILAEGRREISNAARTRLDEIGRREERLLQRKREIEAALVTQARERRTAAEIRRAALEVAGDLDSLDFFVKRALVRQLVRRVTVSGRSREGVRLTIYAR